MKNFFNNFNYTKISNLNNFYIQNEQTVFLNLLLFLNSQKLSIFLFIFLNIIIIFNF